MKTISLVVATIARERELDRLLSSLESQSYLPYEVIIVDQNVDDRAEKVVKQHNDLPITILKCLPRGANVARNIGFRAATGEIIGFPDDDCWFDSNVLQKVQAAFELRDIKAISGKVLTDYAEISSGRWQKYGGLITRDNVWTTTIEFASFFLGTILEQVDGFDECLGPGTKSIYGAHEVDELFIRILKYTDKVEYLPGILVRHNEPLKVYNIQTLNRAFRYGAGLGYVVKKHHYPFRTLMNFMIRSAGGATISLFKRKPDKAKFYLAVFLGRFFGWISYTGRCKN